MSFGFPDCNIENYSILEAAVEAAYSAHVLMFAAASNSGANLLRAYPARHAEVICVHSTDSKGNRSKFSPTAEEGDNFATIGEFVLSTWPESLRDAAMGYQGMSYKSGTSFSTPIAACVGAFLLKYARINLPSDKAKKLKKGTSMRAMLRRIAEKKEGVHKRDGYDYVELSLHSDNLFGKDKDYVKSRLLDALM